MKIKCDFETTPASPQNFSQGRPEGVTAHRIKPTMPFASDAAGVGDFYQKHAGLRSFEDTMLPQKQAQSTLAQRQRDQCRAGVDLASQLPHPRLKAPIQGKLVKIINMDEIANSPGLPTSFARLLRKRPVVYAPAVSQGDPVACQFTSARAAEIVPHHRPQETMTTCSAYTALVVINAIRSARALAGCSLEDILSSNLDGAWASCVATLQSKGVSLGQFHRLLQEAARRWVADSATVTPHFVREVTEQTRNTIRALLTEFERDPGLFLVANLQQAAYMEDGFDVGHMSVVGGYDTAHDQVLIFDVDIRGLQPYWISTDLMLKGLHTYDATSEDFRGLLALHL